MGEITRLAQSYKDGKITFAELKRRLVAFPWKEPEWLSPLQDESISLTEAAMEVDENMFDPEEDTLEELEAAETDELITAKELRELETAIWHAGQDQGNSLSSDE